MARGGPPDMEAELGVMTGGSTASAVGAASIVRLQDISRLVSGVFQSTGFRGFTVTPALFAPGVPSVGLLALGLHPVEPSDIRDYPTEQPPWCSVTIRWSDGHTATVKSTVPAIVKTAKTIKRKDLEGVEMEIVVMSGDMQTIDYLQYTPKPK
jgi:hypothetical protein